MRPTHERSNLSEKNSSRDVTRSGWPSSEPDHCGSATKPRPSRASRCQCPWSTCTSACTEGASGERAHVGDPASGTTSEEDGEAEQPEAEQSYGDWARQAADELVAQRRRAADARRAGTVEALPETRRHDITRVPVPWGVAPQQDALTGVITSYDTDGRCSYAATHKCHSTHNHWSRCLVVDHPDDAEFWGDVTHGAPAHTTSARLNECGSAYIADTSHSIIGMPCRSATTS